MLAKERSVKQGEVKMMWSLLKIIPVTFFVFIALIANPHQARSDDKCSDVLAMQSIDSSMTESQKLIYASAMKEGDWNTLKNSNSLGILANVDGSPLDIKDDFKKFQQSVRQLQQQLNVNWSTSDAQQLSRVYLSSDQISGWTQCMTERSSSAFYITQDPSTTAVLPDGDGNRDIIFLNLVWHPGNDLGSATGFQFSGKPSTLPDDGLFEKDGLLLQQNGVPLPFTAGGSRPLAVKTDAAGRLAITFFGTTATGTSLQARLVVPARPTFTPATTSPECTQRDSASPFKYCTECDFSLAGAQIGANVAPSLTAGPTITRSCRGFKPQATLFIQASGAANCMAGTVGVRLALQGPDGAEINRNWYKASSGAPSIAFDLHGNNVTGAADGFNSATIENLECTSPQQNNAAGIQSAVVFSSDAKVVIQSR